MLNKELMLNSKPYEPHILLTVDENESYEYGYIYQDLGSVNRRPYWVIDEVRYHLFELYYDESFYNVTGLSFDPFPAPKMYLRMPPWTHTVQPQRHQLIIDIADQEVFVEIEIAL